MPQHRQHDHGDPPGRLLAPPRPNHLQVARSSSATKLIVVLDSGRQHWQTA